MISLVKKSLQIELHSFMQVASGKHKTVSNSAFNQARMKIKPELFKHFITGMNQEFYSDNDERVKLWNGFRLLSCDCSTMKLPITPELKKIYRYNINQYGTDVLIARTSVLYDLENEMILEGILSPFSTGERKLAMEHLKVIKKSGYKELLLLDRGYPSYDIVYQLQKMSIDFVMRVKPSFSNVVKEFAESDLIENKIQIRIGKNVNPLHKIYKRNEPIEVRLIKVMLGNGEIELLMTSLMDEKKYNASIFKELYFKRWTIETLYDKLKNKLLIEHFTGYSQTSILQDFYCTLFINNIQSLLTSEANEKLEQNNTKDRKYEYKINTNLSIGFIKTKIVELLLQESNPEKILIDLEKLFEKNTIPIRPNRHFKRDIQKYRKRAKPPITKNFKHAF